MASVYIIHFIQTGEELAYTTVTALCEAHSNKEINITRSPLNTYMKESGYYKNSKVIIKKFTPLTATQVRAKKTK